MRKERGCPDGREADSVPVDYALPDSWIRYPSSMLQSGARFIHYSLLPVSDCLILFSVCPRRLRRLLRDLTAPTPFDYKRSTKRNDSNDNNSNH